MKKKLFLLSFILIIALATSVFATDEEILLSAINDSDAELVTPQENTEATEEGTEETAEATGEEDIVDSARYFYGDNITIDELIDGNVFATGKKVTFSGEVGGDLVIIAEEVTIKDGVAYGSSVIIANKFVIESGEIRGNLYTVAAETSINGRIYDMYAVADKFTLEYDGYIYRDLKVMSTETILDGIVGRNVYIETDKLSLNKDCIIPGSLTYKALNDATYNDGENGDTTEIPDSVVSGEINYTKTKGKIFKKSISDVVKSIIADNKITKASSEADVKSAVLSYVFNALGVSTRSETVKGTNSGVRIPTPVFIILILVIVALVCALILPKVIVKGDKAVKSEVKE